MEVSDIEKKLSKEPQVAKCSYWKEEELKPLKSRNSKLFEYIQRKGPVKRPSPPKQAKENMTNKDQQLSKTNKNSAEEHKNDPIMSCKSD